MDNAPKSCPFCGKIPESVCAKVGAWKGFSRAFHRCSIMGYMDICDWTEGNVEKLDFSKWNTRT